jgi:MerR family copper efflux transcriptional regulator
MKRHFTIGKLAQAVGVGIDTVRYYERLGLMPEPVRGINGYRRYGDTDLERLQFIRRAQELGFSLAEIDRLLTLTDQQGDRAGVRALATSRLAEIERQLGELQQHRIVLSRLIEACSGLGTVTGCPIIEAVVQPPHQRKSHDPIRPDIPTRIPHWPLPSDRSRHGL